MINNQYKVLRVSVNFFRANTWLVFSTFIYMCIVIILLFLFFFFFWLQLSQNQFRFIFSILKCIKYNSDINFKLNIKTLKFSICKVPIRLTEFAQNSNFRKELFIISHCLLSEHKNYIFQTTGTLKTVTYQTLITPSPF